MFLQIWNFSWYTNQNGISYSLWWILQWNPSSKYFHNKNSWHNSQLTRLLTKACLSYIAHTWHLPSWKSQFKCWQLFDSVVTKSGFPWRLQWSQKVASSISTKNYPAYWNKISKFWQFAKDMFLQIWIFRVHSNTNDNRLSYSMCRILQ